jgi:ethanolamine ammonia-lyase large subunit
MKIEHDISRLVCDIAATALPLGEAARQTITIIREIVGKSVNSSLPPPA